MSSAIERRIAQAIEDGEFDDLPGRGEPLSLDALASDENLAHRLLVDHGFALPWIEVRQQIDKEWAEAQRGLSQRMLWLKSRGQQLENSPTWARAVEKFRKATEELNQRIDDYNLSVPLSQFQRRRLDGEAEIARLVSG
ncbi:MAG: DnaJ family domain-containing protein [Anaerolineales bacterium]